MKKILCIIDMQNDFISGVLGTPEAESIVENVCNKIKNNDWDAIYTTMDTHYSNRYLSSQEGKKLPILHCIRHTEGWDLNDKVWDAIDSVIEDIHYEEICKLTFGSFKLVEHLDDFLKFSDAEITLIGVCSNICVISNAILLKSKFPNMKIIVDASCCAGTTPKRHKMALEMMKDCHIDVINED